MKSPDSKEEFRLFDLNYPVILTGYTYSTLS